MVVFEEACVDESVSDCFARGLEVVGVSTNGSSSVGPVGDSGAGDWLPGFTCVMGMLLDVLFGDCFGVVTPGLFGFAVDGWVVVVGAVAVEPSSSGVLDGEGDGFVAHG